MAYDAAEAAAVFDPPEITVQRGGFFWKLLRLDKLFGSRKKTYRGKILSHREFLPFRDRLLALAAGESDMSAREQERLWYEYLRAIKIPPRVVFSLPPAVMEEALVSFYMSQLRALSMPTNRTNGTHSRPAVDGELAESPSRTR